MEKSQSIKFVCFDMDGTLTVENTWYKLNLALGITEAEDQELYDAYINGDLVYEAWIEKLVALYKERGLATKENVQKVFSDLKLQDGAKELVSELKQRGLKVAILTGSFDFVAGVVAEMLDIPHYRANTKMVFNADGMIDTLIPAADEIANKPGMFRKLCTDLSVLVEESVCVGDGIGDIELFKLPIKGVSFNHSPEELKKLSWRTVDSLCEVGGLF